MIIRTLYAPDVPVGGTGVAEKPTIDKPKADDDISLLDSLIGDKDLADLDEQEKEDDKKSKDKSDEEDVLDDEDDDVLDDDKKPEEDLIEEDTNTRAIDLKKVKEKYPEFAKTNEFRELRNAYFREGKYTELFPTLEDAQEAAENNEIYMKINTAVVDNGDINPLLAGIKEANPESFKKIANNFLDNIAKIDNGLYTEVITPVVKRLARQIHAEGQKFLKRNAESPDGLALVASARNILQFYFEDADGIDKEDPKPDPKISEKEEELKQRESGIRKEKFDSAYKVCDRSVETRLDKQILDGLDPDNKLNEFTRDTLLEKIKNDVKNQITKDNLHMRRMTSLWKRAEATGFNRESLSSIVTAYLERARPIIPASRAKFRNMAIRGKAADHSESDDNKDVKIANRGRTGRAPANDGKVNLKAVDSKKINYRETSDDDIMSGKVKLRG